MSPSPDHFDPPSAPPGSGSETPPTDLASSAIIDRCLEKNLLAGQVRIAFVIGMTMAGAVVALAVLGPAGVHPAVVIAIMVCFLLALGLLKETARRRARRDMQARVRADPGDVHALLGQAVPPRGDLHAVVRLRALAESLAQAGRTGLAIRICPPEMIEPLPAITVPFEPRPLDFAHRGFDDADLSADGAVEPTDGASSARAARHRRSSTAAPTDTSFATIRRNILLKGGWFIVIVFGFQVVVTGLDSWSRGYVTWQFGLWLLAFAVTLLVPARAGARGRQCLVVPSGLILRKSRWRDETWDVHLFERRRSVLLVYRHWRHQWRLRVADAQRSEAAIGTREEMRFVLRAWISPLPPPDAVLLEGLA